MIAPPFEVVILQNPAVRVFKKAAFDVLDSSFIVAWVRCAQISQTSLVLGAKGALV